MFERILVALDGSPFAEQAVPFASVVARTFGSEVILLRVVEGGVGAPVSSLDSFGWRLGRAEAIEYLSGVKRQFEDQGIRVDIDVTAGRACDEILEMARIRQVGLVVLGSHGTGGLTRLHLASTAQKVVFGSDTSVLVVPAAEAVRIGSPYATVVVPVDCSHHSEWAASAAARLARSQEAELVLVHVVAEPAILDPQGTAREARLVDELTSMNRRSAAKYLAGLQARLKGPGLVLRTRVKVARDVTLAVEQEVDGEDRPLVVLGTKGASRCEHGPYGGLVTVMLSGVQHPALVLRELDRKDRPRGKWRQAEASVVQHRVAAQPE